jgi:hypothetical protein
VGFEQALKVCGEYYLGRCEVYSVKNFYISDNIPVSSMKADTDKLPKNNTAPHVRNPQYLHTPLLKPHGAMRIKPVYIRVTSTKSTPL